MTATNECKGFRKSTLAEFRADPVGFLRRAADSLEPTAQFKIGGRTLVLLKDAADIEELFVKKQLSFQKGPGLLRLRQVLGDSLLTSDDSTHANNRRHFQPAFSIPKVADYGASMPILAHELTADWRSGETVDVLREMSRMTLAILAATVFNSTAKPDHESIGAAISDNINAVYGPLTSRPQTSTRHTSSRAELIDAMHTVLDGHTPESDDSDFVTLLYDSKLQPEQRIDEGLTFLLGGHESVSVAMTWTWYALSQNDSVRKQLEDEIDRVNSVDLQPDLLPYTRKVIAESMRLYPPAWMFSREALVDVEIGGNRYPKGTVFIVAPCVTHVDPKYWIRPFEFNPDRWNSNQFTLSANPRFSYFPFGGGARRCIGEQFALTELTVVLATLSKSWRLDPLPGSTPPTFDPVVTMRPAGKLQMRLSERLRLQTSIAFPVDR